MIAHRANGQFDLDALLEQHVLAGLEGMDLAKEYRAADARWSGGRGQLAQDMPSARMTRPRRMSWRSTSGPSAHIFRNLSDAGARVTVLPATAAFDEVMAHQPTASSCPRPGRPRGDGGTTVPVIRQMLETGKPLFGICLGHQLLGLAVGATTTKMHQGHRGANHPVKRLADGRVEITSMNHGFAVETESLPDNARPTHVSLFDGSNCGLELTDRTGQGNTSEAARAQDSVIVGKFVEQLRNERADAHLGRSCGAA